MSSLSPEEDKAISALETIEMEQAAVGNFDFVPLSILAKTCGLSEAKIEELLESLKSQRLVLWDKQAGVKSRIGHTVLCLYNSEAVSRARRLRNIADLKYIRYIKQAPQYRFALNDDETVSKMDAIIPFLEIEQSTNRIITQAIASLSTPSYYERISEFQLKATQQILSSLKERKGAGIVLVAETGSGKSFAYQLPLLVWILYRKMRAYAEGRRTTNCGAMLVFPRVVLAQDQYEEIQRLISVIHDALNRLRIPTSFRGFLQFKVVRDFGGVNREKREAIYSGNPDIIITNPETLKRRLLDPVSHAVYRYGIDLVLYDEIHLYSGLTGAYTAGLNARLRTILPNSPVFIGMSATIANPEKHCQRLFALNTRPTLISDRSDLMQRKSVEHHIILKPRAGRSPLGAAVDALSCLVHNRRDGMANTRSLEPPLRPKSICFSDSLDLTGRWTRDQNDLEFFQPPADRPPIRPATRGYPLYYRPAKEGAENFGEACVSCHEGHDVIAGMCPLYKAGHCWYFSQDSRDPNLWRELKDGSFIPEDSLRSKRMTSQEVKFEEGQNVYDLFRHQLQNWWGNDIDIVDVDNLIATGVLEVGVDFQGIKEIAMYGEIKSPANYKQKAGRGAREGNVTDGLTVLSVIPQMPLANFYYRHFFRLVNPTLSPVPLEPNNPDSIRAHAFGAILDYFALKDIDIYNVLDINTDAQSVERQFDTAQTELMHNRRAIEMHLQKYLSFLGVNEPRIIGEAITSCEHVLKSLCEEVAINGERRRFVTWMFEGSRNGETLRDLDNEFKEQHEELNQIVSDATKRADEFSKSTETMLKTLTSIGREYAPLVAKLKAMEELQ